MSFFTQSAFQGVLMITGVIYLPLVFLLYGCGSPPEEIDRKLHDAAILDLEYIVEELSPSAKRQGMLAKPFYKIGEVVEYHGDSASVIQAYARIDFFYLSPELGLYQVRKYQYKRSARDWERIDVKLLHLPDSLRN
jgi:hypothetical protein